MNDTQIDKEQRAAEKKMLDSLESIALDIREGGFTPAEAHSIYDAEIRNLVYAAMQSHYFLQIQKLNNHSSITAKLDGSDTAKIEADTDKAVAHFWHNVTIDLGRADNLDGLTGDKLTHSDYMSQHLVTGILLSNLTATKNEATLKKQQELIDGYVSIHGIEGLPHGVRTVRWVTKKDEKVCRKICAPLDGEMWEIDDPTLRVPPFDAHPNCRCDLDPVGYF